MNNGVNNSTFNNSGQPNVPNGTLNAQSVQSSQQVAQTTNQAVNQNAASNQNIVSSPQIIQNIPIQTATNIPQPTVVTNQNDNSKKDKGSKKKLNLIPILFIIILILLFYIIYSHLSNKTKIDNLIYSCTPITASEEKKELDLDSTLVKDLYSKVATNIREDLAQPEFNDNMRLYLAYRQILETEKYDSHCNLFDKLAMEPYTCEVSTTFVPKAFKKETMVQAIKKMYGENTDIPLANIKLGNACIGGYQYIAARGEFVQGFCNQQTATSYRVTKNLKSATSTRNTIILEEEVKYHENEGMSLPEYLKSGTYYYTFRLDMNYNYVLVSKTYESKY